MRCLNCDGVLKKSFKFQCDNCNLYDVVYTSNNKQIKTIKYNDYLVMSFDGNRKKTYILEYSDCWNIKNILPYVKLTKKNFQSYYKKLKIYACFK
jgi:hypothetical protein